MMDKRDVLDYLGVPDKIIPSRLGMVSEKWKCAKCGGVFEFITPVRPPSPCIGCGSIFFEKIAPTAH